MNSILNLSTEFLDFSKKFKSIDVENTCYYCSLILNERHWSVQVLVENQT